MGIPRAHDPRLTSAVEKFDTLRLAPSKRLTFWNELVEQVYTGTWVNTPKQDFAAEMWRWKVGDLKMIRPISDPAQVGRSADLSTDEEHLVLHLQRRGKSRHCQDRREAELAPGDFILVSSSKAYTIDANKHEMLVVQFPRKLIAGKVRGLDDRVATMFSAAGPSQRVFHDFLLSLWHQGDQSYSDPDWQSGVANVFADLLALASGAERGERPFLWVDRHNVAVAHVQHWLTAPASLQPRDQVRPLWIARDDLDRDALLLEHPFQVVGDQVLVAGRIAGIEAEKRLEVRERFLLQCRPVGRCLRLGSHSPIDNGGGDNDQDSCKNDCSKPHALVSSTCGRV